MSDKKGFLLVLLLLLLIFIVYYGNDLLVESGFVTQEFTTQAAADVVLNVSLQYPNQDEMTIEQYDYTWFNVSVNCTRGGVDCDAVYGTLRYNETGYLPNKAVRKVGGTPFNILRILGNSQVSLWNKTYDSGTGEEAFGVAVDSSNNAYVAGAEGSDWRVMKIDSNGLSLWTKTYNVAGNGLAWDMSIDSNDNLYAVGHETSGNQDFRIMKINSNGVSKWNKTYDLYGFDMAFGVAVENDNIYVVGWETDRWGVIKLNSTGHSKWNKNYDVSTGNDGANGVAVDNNGDIYVVGWESPGTVDWRVMKIDSNGVSLWNRSYNPGANDIANAVAIDSSNNIYVVGYEGNDWRVMKINSNGVSQWNRTYDPGSKDYAFGVAIDSSDNLYVVGMGNNNAAWRVMKINSDGVSVDNRTYDSSSGEEVANSIAIDSNDNLYVVGYETGTDKDWRVMRFQSYNNPTYCGTLKENQICNLRFKTIATGLGTWQLDVLLNSSNILINDNDTKNVNVTISTLASGTTYYIDATGGDDSKDGLSELSAWQTISKVNSLGFNPGDQILFKKGETWMEQLTVPSSGNSTHQIIFGTYGNGDNPLITGESIRTRTLYINNNNYITIENITLSDSAESNEGSIYINNAGNIRLDNIIVSNNLGFAGIYIEGTGSNNTIQNSTIYNTIHTTTDRGNGIVLDGAAGNHSLTGNIIYSNDASGIKLGMSACTDDNIISYNTIYQNGAAGISVNGDGTTCNRNIIERNTIYENGQLEPDYYGIDLYQVGNDSIIRYNIIHNQTFLGTDSGGIRFGGEPAGIFGSGNQIYYNIIYNETEGIHLLGANNSFVYNNVVYDSSFYSIHIQGDATDSNVVKNNILHTATTHLVYNQDATNSIFDYNLYYPDGNSAFNWNDVTYNFADWQTNAGQDINSLASDPLLADPNNDNYTIQPTSSAIDAGINVGLTQDYGGITVPQGSFVDIGAFEFQTTTTTIIFTPSDDDSEDTSNGGSSGGTTTSLDTTTTSSTTTVKTTVNTVVTTTSSTTTTIPVQKPRNKTIFIIAAIVAAIAIAMGSYLYFNKEHLFRKQEVDPQILRLKNAVQKSLKQGYSKETIRREAIKQGWPENIINKVIK